MSQHGQRDMPIPALSVAHLVVIQSAFTFSRLKGLPDQPALSGHSDQSFNRVFTAGGVTQIVSALWLLFDAAPYQKRPRPTILFRQWHQRPFVEPFALATEAGGKAFPSRCGRLRVHRLWCQGGQEFREQLRGHILGASKTALPKNADSDWLPAGSCVAGDGRRTGPGDATGSLAAHDRDPGAGEQNPGMDESLVLCVSDVPSPGGTRNRGIGGS